jgi:excisionase family DNA binding protein
MSIEETIQNAVAETVRTTVSESIETALSQRLNSMLKSFEDRLNLQTYSVSEAAEITGIYYKKMYRLIKEGVLASFTVGSSIRIKHTDLYNYIEKQKHKNETC